MDRIYRLVIVGDNPWQPPLPHLKSILQAEIASNLCPRRTQRPLSRHPKVLVGRERRHLCLGAMSAVLQATSMIPNPTVWTEPVARVHSRLYGRHIER